MCFTYVPQPPFRGEEEEDDEWRCILCFKCNIGDRMEVMTVGMDPFEYFAKLLKLNCYSLGGGGWSVCVLRPIDLHSG